MDHKQWPGKLIHLDRQSTAWGGAGFINHMAVQDKNILLPQTILPLIVNWKDLPISLINLKLKLLACFRGHV